MHYCSSLNALDSYLNPVTIIVLRGEAASILAWQQRIFRHYLPDVLCYAIQDNVDLPPELEDKKMTGSDVCAYICEGLSCSPPITELGQFQKMIDKRLNESRLPRKPQ